MRILLMLLTSACLVAGCVTPKESESNVVTTFKPGLTEEGKATRTSFIGTWKSNLKTKEGGTREAVIERLTDSRYFVEFKIYDSKGRLETLQKEFGFWGVSGGIYFTMYRGWIEGNQVYEADPSDAYNYDSYKILEVSEQTLVYQSLSSGNKFTYTRAE